MAAEQLTTTQGLRIIAGESPEWTGDDDIYADKTRHVRAGRRIVRTCIEAMRVSGTICEWEEWTGIALPDSGNYVIPLALAPLTVNRETDQATYLEPNVWVEHRVG